MPIYQRLTAAEIVEAAERYFAARESKSAPQSAPTMVLVGGQPGAGKSVAAGLVRNEFEGQGGFVHVDADRMRARIDTRGTSPTSQETQPDAGALAVALRNLAIDGRRNIVEEGTFRNPEAVATLIEQMHSKGYRVEMVAVATSYEESILGIYQRYEAQHAQGLQSPRFVDEAYHLEAMDGFVKTVARDDEMFDRVRVIDRGGNQHFDSLVDAGDKPAVFALSKGLEVSDKRLAELADAWSKVRGLAVNRSAPEAYVQAVDDHAQDVVDTQKGRIHLHALTSLATHFKSLAGDRRFDAHTDEELTRAAYFRGFHEKAFEFKGLATDFVAYDEQMSDRKNLSTLPAVADLDGRTLVRGVDRHQARDDDLSL